MSEPLTMRDLIQEIRALRDEIRDDLKEAHAADLKEHEGLRVRLDKLERRWHILIGASVGSGGLTALVLRMLGE